MKQLRRIDLVPAVDAYAKALRGTLRYVALSEAEFRALERERPALVVIDDEAVLIGQPSASAVAVDLQYAFPDHGAFARQFPAMLQRLLPAVDAEEAPLGLRFRLTERSMRPYVESVLFANAFEQTREWWRMTLAELPEGRAPGRRRGDREAGQPLVRPTLAHAGDGASGRRAGTSLSCTGGHQFPSRHRLSWTAD